MTRKPQFVVDVNVGRVATWLRVMGYDTLFPQERGDNELVRLALRDGRVLVTRDSGIAVRRAARLGQLKVVQVVDDDLPSQLRQLVRELGLKLDGGFSRCVRCNDPLIAVAKADVGHQAPPYVRQTQTNFMQCPRCLRIYWRGIHWSNMVSELDKVYEESP